MAIMLNVSRETFLGFKVFHVTSDVGENISATAKLVISTPDWGARYENTSFSFEASYMLSLNELTNAIFSSRYVDPLFSITVS